MKTKPTVVTLLLLLALVLTLSANNVAIEAHAQAVIIDLQDFCDDYAPVTLVDEESYTTSSCTTITDFAGNSYYYSTVSPQGYIIMHAATQKVVEAAFDDADPFAGIDVNDPKFYAGPGYYFQKVTKDGVQVYLSSTGEEYALDDEILVAMSTELNAQMSTTPEVDTSQPNSAKTFTDAEGYTYINDYRYFTLLMESQNATLLPGDQGKACGFNALAIVLGYLNSYRSSSIVPSQYIRTISFDYHPNQNLSYNNISLEDVTYLPIMNNDGSLGSGNNIVNKLRRYVYDDGEQVFGGYPVAAAGLRYTMDCFIDEFHPGEEDNFVQYNNLDIKWCINQGYPTIASILNWHYDSDGNEKIGGHNLIVYAYKNDMYKTLEPVYGTFSFISYRILTTAYAVDYVGEHQHAEHLWVKNNQCKVSYCPCGYKTCDHASGLFNSNHGCISCGVVYHPWVYTGVYTASIHQLQCNHCGIITTEDHMLKPGPLGSLYCSCGYDTGDFGEITLGNPNQDDGI